MSKKSRSSNKAYAARRSQYRITAISNRERRLARHLKAHPLDKQSAKAVGKMDIRSGRKSQYRGKVHQITTIDNTAKGQVKSVTTVTRLHLQLLSAARRALKSPFSSKRRISNSISARLGIERKGALIMLNGSPLGNQLAKQ